MSTNTLSIKKSGGVMRKFRFALIAVAMLSGLAVVAAPPQADAVNSFDAELIGLVNAHRESLGRSTLVPYPPLSAASQNWSNTMANNSGSAGSCSSSGFGHDPNQTTGLPPGTNGGSSENINFVCSPVGLKLHTTHNGGPGGSRLFTYSGQPAACNAQRMDWNSALFTFCTWINSSAHRNNIETRSHTHMGSGTTVKNGGGNRTTFATHRFAGGSISGLSCAGLAVTIDIGAGQNPTPGNDVILGTAAADSINGQGGNDVICGLGGDDNLKGGPGEDIIYGGNGADTIAGGGGNDALYGEGGADIIKGQGGSDMLDGGIAGDSLEGNGAPDVLFGRGGPDNLIGGNGGDHMYGGLDNDVAKGVLGPDWAFGASGNDDLFGGNGNDDLRGGAGTDKCSGNTGIGDQAEGSTCEQTPGIEIIY